MKESKLMLYVNVPIDINKCWLWTRSRTKAGYGQFRDEAGKGKLAHRRIYELFNGPIPLGLELDHLCRNRICVNPLHLESVTHKENCLRGVGCAAQNAKKTHCPKGHQYSKENTIKRLKGHRACRTCESIWARARYWKRRAA